MKVKAMTLTCRSLALPLRLQMRVPAADAVAMSSTGLRLGSNQLTLAMAKGQRHKPFDKM